ncbi:MAG: EF-P beta-lysylation protein EpmB [Planctomycetaceae bacterium]|nr:EF-P beta-lysylation protein EpmB [Planctomycetaceae bacterium]
MPSVPDAFLANSDVSSVPNPARSDGWQRELANAIRSVEVLLRRLNLNPHDPQTQSQLQIAGIQLADQDTLQHFPVLVPENFLARMTPGDLHDPLLRQVLPQAAESLSVAGFVPDPVSDLNARRTVGVLQKYAGRVLLIATGACAVHCRYCFRRDYPYAEEPRRLQDWQPALDEIASDHSITEVIFSGGDPFMLNDARLQVLCAALDQIPHVERIRFHTRLPVVLPARVTSELITMLTGLRAQPIVVVHANHANELVSDCADALRKLVRSGIPVLNQAVLLSGVNDNLGALEMLCRRLINLGVMPYYLHQLDRVSGTAHFEVDRALGQQWIQNLAARLPGYAIPRFVQEIPGEPNKTTL